MFHIYFSLLQSEIILGLLEFKSPSVILPFGYYQELGTRL